MALSENIVPALIALTLIGSICTILLSLVARVLKAKRPATEHSISHAVNKILPQTQCGQCGYPGCKPYADAIENGDAINKCPPGGQETVNRLAKLLDVPSLPLLQSSEDSTDTSIEDTVVVIREPECIGCTKCIVACPVDAIVGAPKFMHTVIEELCTGCNLCIEPCPVDCIDIKSRQKTVLNSVIASDRPAFTNSH